MAQISIVLSVLLQAAAPATGAAPQAMTPPVQLAQATPDKEKAKDDPNRIICKRHLKVGTLADFEKTCLTKAQWQRYSDNQRDAWQDMQGSKGSTHGG